MGHWIKLKASDGFELGAWRAEPKAPRAAASSSCRKSSASTRISARSPTATPPTAISRSRRPFSIAANETPISPTAPTASRAAARSSKRLRARRRCSTSAPRSRRPRAPARSASSAIAWAARSHGWPRRKRRACRRPSAITAAASSALKDLKPRVPTMLHFGEKDEHIPVAGVREVAAAHPDVPIYFYPRRPRVQPRRRRGLSRAQRGPGEIAHAGVLRQASGLVAQASRAPWAGRSRSPGRGEGE